MAGLLIFRAHDLKIAPLPTDQHIGPAVGSHFLPNLILVDWSVAGNKYPSVAALSSYVNHSDGAYQERRCYRPHQESIRHAISPSMRAKRCTFKVVLKRLLSCWVLACAAEQDSVKPAKKRWHLR